MISLDRKYKTRDGRDVRVLCVDGPDPCYPVVAVVRCSNELHWEPFDFTVDGRKHREDNPSASDLIEVKPEHHGWMNVYRTYGGIEPGLMGGGIFPTKHKADEQAKNGPLCGLSDRIACIPVHFEEGLGLPFPEEQKL